MKRPLVLLFLAIVVAGVIGTLIARDPGYVMISYDGHTLQTGLWVLVGLIVAIVVASFYLFRLLRLLLSSGGLMRAWRSEHQRRRSRKQTAEGLSLLNEGVFDRALKLLRDAASNADYPAINYLYAARAAENKGDIEERERLMRLAEDAGGASPKALAVASAEMDIDRGRYQRALDRVAQVSDSESVVRIKSRALLALKDWQGMADLMPALKKQIKDPAEITTLQVRVALARMAAAETDDALSIIFRKQPEVVRHTPEVISLYCRKLASETEAEVAVRDALNRDWMPHLLSLYGELGERTLSRRIKSAENWLRQHADDAALQLCLGKLFEANGEGQKARAAFRKSVDLGGEPEASVHLGRLLAFDGQYKESSEQLSRALNAEIGPNH